MRIQQSTNATCNHAYSRLSLLLSFLTARFLARAHTYTHAYTRTHTTATVRPVGTPAISTWRSRRAWLVEQLPTTTGCQWSSPRIGRTVIAAANIHIRSRAGLPRLFKFTLTVHSSYRRTPAIAPAAPNVTHDTSALFVREPTNRSHAHRVYFNRDATRRHRSTPFIIVGETAKMAAAVTWLGRFMTSVNVKGPAAGHSRLLHVITWPYPRACPMGEVFP